LPQKKLKLDGMIRPFSKDFVLEDQANQVGNNFIIQGLNKELMEDLSGNKFLPYIFELSALSNLSLEPIWQPTSLKSTRHFGYAIQWFALSLVVLFGGFYLFRKKKQT
jgi:cytochrome oxidase assembly protein ShyY1